MQHKTTRTTNAWRQWVRRWALVVPVLADNGSAWYVTGASDSRWNDSDLHLLNGVHGSDFEVVDTSSLVNGP